MVNQSYNTPQKKYKLELTPKSKTKFMKIFIIIYLLVNFTKGKFILKLGRCMNRFSKAILENEEESEQLVDFITCLESVYSSKEQQLS